MSKRDKILILVFFAVLISGGLVIWQTSKPAKIPGSEAGHFVSPEELAQIMEQSKPDQVDGPVSPTVPSGPAAVIKPTIKEGEFFDLLYSKDFLKLLEAKTTDFSYITQEQVLYEQGVNSVANLTGIDVGTGSLATLAWGEFKIPPAKIKIYRSVSSVELGDLIAELPGEAKGYHDLTVQKGEVYYYTIVVENEKGEQSNSNTVIVGPIRDIEPPLSPSNIQVLPLEEEPGFRITWQNPKSRDLAYINIYRSTEKGILSDKTINNKPLVLARISLVGVDLVSTQDPVSTQSIYEDKDIEPNITYYYTITAEDQDGNESAKSLAGPLPSPGNPNLFSPPY